VTADWLVAESVWWGRLRGASAFRLVDGCVTGRPVPVAEVPAGARHRKLPGTVLPGLIDAHGHSALVDLGTVRAGGIAAVWDLGGVPDRVAALRDRARHRPDLPRLRIAGPFLTAPGGYPSDRAWAPPGSSRAVRSPRDASDAVAECVALGVDLVKVTAHAGGPLLPDNVLAAVVEAAHVERLPVVVHAEGPGTVAAAVDAGADLLAHTPWTERQDDGLLRGAADAGMRWISTLDIHGWGRVTAEHGTAIDNLRRFLGYGGRVCYGTDLGNGPLVPGVNPREIRALQRAGLTPEDILAAMTGSPIDSDDRGELPPCWIPGGLELDDTRFADVLATARVIGPEVQPWCGRMGS
jgi:imidazolonepropionase-like amidohydrolase